MFTLSCIVAPGLEVWFKKFEKEEKAIEFVNIMKENLMVYPDCLIFLIDEQSRTISHVLGDPRIIDTLSSSGMLNNLEKLVTGGASPSTTQTKDPLDLQSIVKPISGSNKKLN